MFPSVPGLRAPSSHHFPAPSKAPVSLEDGKPADLIARIGALCAQPLPSERADTMVELLDAALQQVRPDSPDSAVLDCLLDGAQALQQAAPAAATAHALVARLAGTLTDVIVAAPQAFTLTQRRVLADSTLARIEHLPLAETRQPLYAALAASCIHMMRASTTDPLNAEAFLDQAYKIATQRLHAAARAEVLQQLGDFVMGRLAAMCESQSASAFHDLGGSTVIRLVLDKPQLVLNTALALTHAADLCFAVPDNWNELHDLAGRIARPAMQLGGHDTLVENIAGRFLDMYETKHRILNAYDHMGPYLQLSDRQLQLNAALSLLKHAAHAVQCINDDDLCQKLATDIRLKLCTLAHRDSTTQFQIACFNEAFDLDPAGGPAILADMLGKFAKLAPSEFSELERTQIANLSIRIECEAQRAGSAPEKKAGMPTIPDWLAAPRAEFHGRAAAAARNRNSELGQSLPDPVAAIIGTLTGLPAGWDAPSVR